MNANICTVTVNASLTLYSACSIFCDSVTLIYACIIIIIIKAESPSHIGVDLVTRTSTLQTRTGQSAYLI